MEALLIIDGIPYQIKRGTKINIEISESSKDLLTHYQQIDS
jgi:hypothetical protein